MPSPLSDSAPTEIILEILSYLDIPSFLCIRTWYPPPGLARRITPHQLLTPSSNRRLHAIAVTHEGALITALRSSRRYPPCYPRCETRLGIRTRFGYYTWALPEPKTPINSLKTLLFYHTYMQLQAAVEKIAQFIVCPPGRAPTRKVTMQQLHLGMWVFLVFATMPGREQDDTLTQYVDCISWRQADCGYRAFEVTRKARRYPRVDGLGLRVVAGDRGSESLWEKFGAAVSERCLGIERSVNFT